MIGFLITIFFTRIISTHSHDHDEEEVALLNEETNENEANKA